MSDFDILDVIRNEIHAEHNLISHRMTWYVTSQAFLMTAYAVSWGKDHAWPIFFHLSIPILGMLLSALAFCAVACAVWVQGDVIKIQKEALDGMKERFKQPGDEDETRRIKEYAQIIGKDRRSGFITHWLAMAPPLIIPILFFVTWLIALSLRGSL